MEFKKSKYYNRRFLGENLYKNIRDIDEVLTIQKFFNMSNIQNEYHVKKIFKDYKLKVLDNYYELDCQQYDLDLFLVFDKPVHITGEYCGGIIAPEIINKSNQNSILSCCVADKITINNNYKGNCYISNLKTNHVYFYNSQVDFHKLEIDNFFIFNKNLKIYRFSEFLEGFKIKCFGRCKNLKNKILNNKEFKEGIIHIE